MHTRVKWRPIRLGGFAHAFRVKCEGTWLHYAATAFCGERGRSRLEDDNSARRCPECVRIFNAIRERENKR